MKVAFGDDGKFAFLFDENEKELGIELLLCIDAGNEKSLKAISDSILAITYAGVPLPDNVIPIH